MTKRLRGGVASHQAKIDTEDRLGIPDLDESINQDRIRNRIEPPADLVSGRGIFKVETAEQPEGDYEKDLEKLKSLTPDELEKLLDEIERKSREKHGLFSKGPLLEGFAIDPQTLESLQSVHHSEIAFDLADQILSNLKKFKDPSNYYIDTNAIKKRIVSGFVYLEVPDFKTPIVKFFPFGVERVDSNVVSKENIRKIINHIKHERKLLPISSDFQAL